LSWQQSPQELQPYENWVLRFTGVSGYDTTISRLPICKHQWNSSSPRK
jgi:hypothetical protein